MRPEHIIVGLIIMLIVLAFVIIAFGGKILPGFLEGIESLFKLGGLKK